MCPIIEISGVHSLRLMSPERQEGSTAYLIICDHRCLWSYNLVARYTSVYYSYYRLGDKARCGV